MLMTFHLEIKWGKVFKMSKWDVLTLSEWWVLIFHFCGVLRTVLDRSAWVVEYIPCSFCWEGEPLKVFSGPFIIFPCRDKMWPIIIKNYKSSGYSETHQKCICTPYWPEIPPNHHIFIWCAANVHCFLCICCKDHVASSYRYWPPIGLLIYLPWFSDIGCI